MGIYLPNGNPVPGPKFDYKLAWMERLRARATFLLETVEPAVLGGDYNVIPEPIDCHDVRVAVLAASWHQQVMDGLVAGAQRAYNVFAQRNRPQLKVCSKNEADHSVGAPLLALLQHRMAVSDAGRKALVQDARTLF